MSLWLFRGDGALLFHFGKIIVFEQQIDDELLLVIFNANVNLVLYVLPTGLFWRLF